MTDKKRAGVFINTMNRPDLTALNEKLKLETGIVFTADLVYQALRRLAAEIKQK